MQNTRMLLVAVLLGAFLAAGREVPRTLEHVHAHTTTNAEEEALATAAAAAATEEPQPAAAAVLMPDITAPAGAISPTPAEPVASAAAATADAVATAAVVKAAAPTAATAATAAAACVSPQFEWPAGSGYCWIKRDTLGENAGPGYNVFKPSNVAVNTNGQLVLTILNPKNKIPNSSCGEVTLNSSYGYGDYIFVVATNPAIIDPRLVGAPFIYDTDDKEFDFEFTRWNVAGAPNSQVVVQPYTVNTPVQYNFNAVDTTHRMRWTPESVVFESYYPASLGGGMFFTYTYTGPNNFVPGTERVHINYWINTRENAVPRDTKYIASCFKFCASSDLATCSTPLGSKPRCSATKTW